MTVVYKHSNSYLLSVILKNSLICFLNINYIYNRNALNYLTTTVHASSINIITPKLSLVQLSMRLFVKTGHIGNKLRMRFLDPIN